MTAVVHPTRLVDPRSLKPHPQNYRRHPADQLAHLVASIREHGFYRNVIVADDDVILAGHGAVLAAIELGLPEIPVAPLPIASTDPRAIKVLVGDNEIEHLAEQDDRALSDLLRSLRESGDSDLALLGTGYDDSMLANLVFVTRPEGEIDRASDADQWVGLPSYEDDDPPVKLVISCETAAQRSELLRRLGISVIGRKERGTWGVTWPAKQAKDDLSSLRIEAS